MMDNTADKYYLIAYAWVDASGSTQFANLTTSKFPMEWLRDYRSTFPNKKGAILWWIEITKEQSEIKTDF
jgi:hypothetical protein